MFLIWVKKYLTLGVVGIVALILSAYLYEKHAHKRAVQEMATFKQQIHDADIVSQAENALNLKIATTKVTEVTLKYDALAKQNNLLNINRNELQQKMGALNAKLNQTQIIADRTRANISDSVRLASVRDNVSASKESSAAIQLSTSNSDLTTLRDACKVTTLDLIKAYGYLEADTLACGRESK